MPRKRASPTTLQHAHELRNTSTQAEQKLWTYLRSHRTDNIHFRRQHAIGNYIVDFCAPSQKLIIELDGSQHLDQENHDRERSDFFRAKGYRILRFWNDEVVNNLEEVIITIQFAISDGQAKP